MALIRLLLVSFAVTVTRLLADDAYEFHLNGKPLEVEIQSLAGTPETPAPGDLAKIEGWCFVLDAPGNYSLQQSEQDRHRLFRIAPDGKKTLLACLIGADDSGRPGGDAINPLNGLSPVEMKALRGVSIGEWPSGAPRQLSRLDLARCWLGISVEVSEEGGFNLRQIPKETCYLDLDDMGGDGAFDLTPLSALKHLRYFEHQTRADGYDLRILQPLRALRYLQLKPLSKVSHPEGLASLKELRTLKLWMMKAMTDSSFLRSLTELRQLAIQDTGIWDLSVIGELPSIASVNAELSGVAQLPERAVPSLRKFNLLGAPVEEKQVAAFQKLNPQCDIRHDWDALLQKALSGADRVRVVSPDFDNSARKVLAEEKDAAAVAELLSAFVVNEETHPFECMCSGSPWLEFYRGDRLLATIAVQHGFGIRWRGWPSDRELLPRGQDLMTDWLARHGVKSSKIELAGKRERDRAENRRRETMQAILPAGVLDALKSADSEAAAVAAFTKNMPDMSQRAEICLRLFGSDFGSWSHSDDMDRLISEHILPGVPPAVLSAIKLQPHLQVANGLGRWLFFDRKWNRWKPQELETVLEIVARDGLTHPRDENRRKTLISLGAIGTPTARTLLRALLGGELSPRPLPEDAVGEAGGMVTFVNDVEGLPDQCSDKVIAAIMLARLKDAEAKPALLEFVGTLQGEERSALEQALAGKKK